MRSIYDPHRHFSIVILGGITFSLFVLGVVSIQSLNQGYSQELNIEHPFENATHIQYSVGDEIYQKPSIRMFIDLIKDPEGFGFSGDPYKFAYNSFQLDINDHGKLRTYFYNLTNSGTNQISISDTQIYPSFTFKMPIGPNSTTQNVEEVSQFFKVGQISTLSNGTHYLSNYGNPITINNTSFEKPFVVVDQYNDGTASLVLISDEPGQRLY